MSGSHLLLNLHQGDAASRIWAWEIRQEVRGQNGTAFFFFFFLIKTILVSELPPTVLAAQKPNVNSWLTVIFLSVIIIFKF